MPRTVKLTIVVVLILLLITVKMVNFLFPLAPPAPELSSDMFYEITYEDMLIYLDLNELEQLLDSQQEPVPRSSNQPESIFLDHDELEQLIDYLHDAKPTRELSINDTPTQKPYYKIDVYNNTDSLWRFFIYEYGGKAYYEIPYTGIYKVNSNILNLL